MDQMMNKLMSQEEIDALLYGTSTDAGSSGDELPAAKKSIQKSVPDVHHAGYMHEPNLAAPLTHHAPECLDSMQADALGEIGNICMGAAATALYTILGRKVSITTPLVECTTLDFLAEEYDIPFVIVGVEYTEGVVGNNLLILRIEDVKKITDIMMGGDGAVSNEDLSELHLSAIGEAMNQMMGGMSTSMADMLNRLVNISPPKTMIIELNSKEIRELIKSRSDSLVKIGFKMEIKGIIDSGIMQLMPLSFAQELVGIVMGTFADEADKSATKAPIPETAQSPAPMAATKPASAQQKPVAQKSQQQAQPEMPLSQHPSLGKEQQQVSGQQSGQPVGYPPYSGWPPYPPCPGQPGSEQGANGQPYLQYPHNPPYGYPPYGYPPYGYPPYDAGQQNGWQQMQKQMSKARSQIISENAQIDAHPVQLNNFDQMHDSMGISSVDGIDMIMDVPLQITVELGQSKKSIKEILDITVGSIITLDKAAGEPVDIVVNGKMIAKGEVIVIDDSYGVRITEIVSPSSRLRNIK